MGQANNRRARIEAMEAMCVGPGAFRESANPIVMLGRTDADSQHRFRAAVRDLAPRPELHSLIDGIDRPYLDRSGWMLVTYDPDGGSVMFKLISKAENALESVLNVVGEGMVARKLGWKTMVYGSESDVQLVKKLVSRFVEDLPVSGQARRSPVLAISQERNPRLLIQISREEVESMDLSATLMALDCIIADIRLFNRVGNAVVFSFTGYDEDPRFLGEIPSVHAYLRQLIWFAPWAPVVTDPGIYMLWCKALDERCTIKTDGNGGTTIYVPPEALQDTVGTLNLACAELVAERMLLPKVPDKLKMAVKSWSEFMQRNAAAVDATLREYDEDAEEVEASLIKEPEQVARNEEEFWSSIGSYAMAPGWLVDPKIAGNSVWKKMRDCEVVIYAMDTQSGWIAAAGFELTMVEKILGEASVIKIMDKAAPSLAISTIRDLGRQMAPLDHPDAKLAVISALVALGSTQLIKLVKDRYGSVLGHYVYMVYSPKRGIPFARSTHGVREDEGVIPLADLYEMAGKVIQSDVANTRGMVGGRISKSGGLILCDALQKYVDGR